MCSNKQVSISVEDLESFGQMSRRGIDLVSSYKGNNPTMRTLPYYLSYLPKAPPPYWEMAFLYLSAESHKYPVHTEYVLAFSCPFYWLEWKTCHLAILDHACEVGRGIKHRSVGSWLTGQNPGSLRAAMVLCLHYFHCLNYSSPSTYKLEVSFPREEVSSMQYSNTLHFLSRDYQMLKTSIKHNQSDVVADGD